MADFYEFIKVRKSTFLKSTNKCRESYCVANFRAACCYQADYACNGSGIKVTSLILPTTSYVLSVFC